MARRPALALARPEIGRPSVRLPSRRAVFGVAGAIALAGVFYLGARLTPVFAVRQVEVVGGTRAAREDVAGAVRHLRGTSLVAVDARDVAAEIEELPSIRSAFVDRAFPHDLRVTISAERVVAVARSDAGAWFVSADGRVVRRATGAPLDLPVVRLPAGARYEVGATLEDPKAARALQALAVLPRKFPVRVTEARGTEGAVTVLIASGGEIRLGAGRSLALKLRVARRVLRALPAPEQSALAYLDVSVPDRPVAGENSQVVGES